MGKAICLESVTVDRKMFLVAARKITPLITQELDVGKLERSPAAALVLTAAEKSNESYGLKTVTINFH